MNDYQHTQQEISRFRRRALLAGFGALTLFSLLFARFFHLQVTLHEHYSTRAESNRISLVPIVPNRGNITDRNGVVLARNYSAFTLEITPSKTNGLEATINALAEVVDIQPKDRRRFKKQLEESKSFESIPIRTRLTDEEVARFAARRYLFPGVEINARLFRQYPEGALAVHALGYISRIREADVKWIAERGEEDREDYTNNYKGTDHIGQTGLERFYEFELHGGTGNEQLEVDKSGRAVRVLTHTAPTPGKNLTLTLDSELQRMAEAAFGERRGSMVALDPNDGSVLALVSNPGFDPNLFVDGIRFDDWDELNTNPDKPLLNRAINSGYAPGSTFKPLMALAALSQGKRGVNYTIADPGYFNFGGRRFMDDKVGGHGSVDMLKSIIVSCNTYYYNLANDLGIDAIARFMAQLGLGKPTGIDLPGESSGTLPSPEWKAGYFKKREQQKWFPGETISVGIGQGYNNYTSLQMAHALANILNYGKVYAPHLVSHITDPTTGEIKRIATEPARQIPLKTEHVDFIKTAMAGVNKQGTGARAFAGAPYESGGKTGTAQVVGQRNTRNLDVRLRDNSWFIAFAPVDQPKIVVAVLVENGGFGAASAAPIARQVFDYYLLGTTKTTPAPEGVATADEGNTEDTEEEGEHQHVVAD
ncbi:penicillin-binding protein [Betaproteobacteria bacterium]|nr:penicillin-binding protein [Betaproteobacteria bacterium]GHU40968.1 penicillin-binding protein [Betaproteobacteria bacterium]